jgi:hypothetical protein
MTFQSDMQNLYAKADEAKAELDKFAAGIERNDMLSARGKQESIEGGQQRYRARVAQLREAAEASIDVEAQRLPRLRRDARAADEKHTRETLGDALAAQLYIKRIEAMDGEQAVAEYEAATPWQRALFGFRPMGQSGADMRLQDMMSKERAPEWQQAEALELELKQARSRVERLDALAYDAALRARYNLK